MIINPLKIVSTEVKKNSSKIYKSAHFSL